LASCFDKHPFAGASHFGEGDAVDLD